ncbi:hypothetical protein GF386_06175 [Candidatus Pacearchaeota archaeon]|nr:hypothetical protein [Candidatus Pacearchaeota archaeon]MBD3283676.1 hypothetical protein [Candidatus Pacearchaeota archaeon]
MEVNETHEKIINILKQKGPSLPINIAKDLQMNSLFISAFLSELANEKRIKVSSMKVGGSPLYYLQGQEEKLENFYKFLHPREAEAFLMLKQKKILKDSEQEPAIRVAMRSIKDFAIPFEKNNEIYWRYMLIPESELKQKPERIQKQEIKKTEKRSKQIQKTPEITVSGKSASEFENPLIIKPEKAKKQKPKSDFIMKTINFLNQNNLKIIEEKNYKSKEYNCIVQIKSELGLINFLTQAKDKRTVTETDLKKLLSNSQKIPLPALLLYTGEISKKAKEYIDNYHSILKTKKIN